MILAIALGLALAPGRADALWHAVVAQRVLAAAQQIPNQRPGRSSVQGLVSEAGGRPLPGADVILQSGDVEVARTVTSGDGVFRFVDVAPGDYSLNVTSSAADTRSPVCFCGA